MTQYITPIYFLQITLFILTPGRTSACKVSPRDKLTQALARLEASSAGLPISVQIIGRPNREDQVLLIMKALEQQFSTKANYPSGMKCTR